MPMSKAKYKEWYLRNRDDQLEKKRAYYLKNRSKHAKLSSEYYRNNEDKIKEYNTDYYRENSATIKARVRTWKLENKGQVNFNNAMRRKQNKLATPGWVNKKQIKEIYINCPVGYHVDHIVPLKGKNVCGLNVPWNLQYLTRDANLRKGNKL